MEFDKVFLDKLLEQAVSLDWLRFVGASGDANMQKRFRWF